MDETVTFQLKLPGPFDTATFLTRLTEGFAEIGADPVDLFVSVLITVPAAHAEQVEQAASVNGLELRRT